MQKLTVLLALFLLLAVMVVPVSATEQPPELDYVDAQLEVFTPRLDTFQAAYYSTHGAYFQALESHSTLPEGVEEPDALNDSPTDQDADLATLWDYAAVPDEINWSFRVDTFTGVDGAGYVLTVTVDNDGDVWTKALVTGPDSESWRGHGWQLYVPFPGL